MSQLLLQVDRSSPVPLYYQLAQQIEQAIERGELKPGERLATEVELADRHGLSRPTVRQAIQELVRKGLLVRRRGVGTLVVHGHLKRRVELSSLYDDLVRTNRRPTTRVLVHELWAAEADVAAALGVPEGADVVHLQRLRYADTEPLALMRNWLPVELAPFSAEELEEHGLYEMLRRTGVHIRIASQRIGARAATVEEARLLGDRRGGPLLTMERTAYDDSGRAVELGRHVYRAQNYSFEVTLVER
ncbi:MAG: GntR family transcriptional regulator [Actinomycetota bacterium]